MLRFSPSWNYVSKKCLGDFKMAPEVGIEPTTNRLTADRSTTELLRKKKVKKIIPLKNKKRNL